MFTIEYQMMAIDFCTAGCSHCYCRTGVSLSEVWKPIFSAESPFLCKLWNTLASKTHIEYTVHFPLFTASYWNAICRDSVNWPSHSQPPLRSLPCSQPSWPGEVDLEARGGAGLGQDGDESVPPLDLPGQVGAADLEDLACGLDIILDIDIDIIANQINLYKGTIETHSTQCKSLVTRGRHIFIVG